jgi:hypothetical protein
MVIPGMDDVILAGLEGSGDKVDAKLKGKL